MVYLSPGTSLSHHDTGPAVVDPLVPVTNISQQSKVNQLTHYLLSKYGVSEPWYFPISPRYWTSCCGSSSSSDKYLTAEQGKSINSLLAK